MDKKEYNKQYREQHREELNAKSKAYYQSLPESRKEEIRRKSRERSRKWRLEAPEEVRKQSREAMFSWRLKIKLEVLGHYGVRNQPICVRCGFSDLRALSIDHINGGGRRDRASCGNSFYRKLQKEGYPDGFQTLCFNCQWIKRFENNENR